MYMFILCMILLAVEPGESNLMKSNDCNCGKSQVLSPVKNYGISGGQEVRPHSFPWIVRIVGGCAGTACGGALISPKLILSAYHCTTSSPYDKKPCDHSDEKRVAVLGLHEFIYYHELNNYYTIPIIDVKYPPNAPLKHSDYDSHDFALLVLKHPAKFSPNVSPICLPQKDEEFSGKVATAAGWGRWTTPEISRKQSPLLQSVDLKVSNKKFKHKKLFGTELKRMRDKYGKKSYGDACSGDSGGPLMYQNITTGKYILIGTVQGGGFNCQTGNVNLFEESDNGIWNKVSYHVDWIHRMLRMLDGEWFGTCEAFRN